MKSFVRTLKLVNRAQKTNVQLYDQGITYNEPGLSYNDIGYGYGGLYEYVVYHQVNKVLPQPLIYALAKDPYTSSNPNLPYHSIGPGFFMYVTELTP